MKSVSFNVAIWAFLLKTVYISTMLSPERVWLPFKVFRTYAVILAKYAISTWPNFFSAQNMDHNQLKTCSKYHLVGLSDEKQGPTFGHFLYLFNLTDPLNL